MIKLMDTDSNDTLLQSKILKACQDVGIEARPDLTKNGKKIVCIDLSQSFDISIVEQFAEALGKPLFTTEQWTDDWGVTSYTLPMVLDDQFCLISILNMDDRYYAVSGTVSVTYLFDSWFASHSDPDYHEITGGDPQHIVAQVEADIQDIRNDVMEGVLALVNQAHELTDRGKSLGRFTTKYFHGIFLKRFNASIKSLYPTVEEQTT